MKVRKFFAILLCIALLTGCAKAPVPTTQQSNETVEDTFISMEKEPVLSYEVPESIPGILVNQLGYLPGSAKVAIFGGQEMPSVFYVVKEDTGEIVYTGNPETEGYDKKNNEYNSYGDFSQLKAEGTYYIEAPVLGRSYSFEIRENLYDAVFKEACKQYYYSRCGMTLTAEYAGESAHNACHIGNAVLVEDISVSMDVTGGWHQDEKGQKSVVTAAKTIGIMLLAYELYGEAFSDDIGIPESGNDIPDLLDEIRYEIDWLLKMQDQQTGAVYSGVTVYTPGVDASGKASDIYVEPAGAEAEKAFAMALAKFSYLYQNYDTQYATICLKAADRAFKHSEICEEDGMDKWKFAAAAEIYRAAGKQSFHQVILDYLSVNTDLSQKDEIILLGGVTYISTKHRVRTDVCERLMDMLMTQAEEISKMSKEALYLTAGDETQSNNDQLLIEMMYLAVVNYIISNHEYETVIENHLHYLFGRNAQALCYIENMGERGYEHGFGSPGIMKQFEADSKLIFMLSEVVINSKKQRNIS